MSFIYLILGFIGIIASLIVVSALNPIHRIGYLILVFMVGAFIFMLLDFYFLGLVYIIVYVGAIAILFLFIIMMVECNTPTEIKNIKNNLDNTLSINLTLPLNNCGGETVTVSPTLFYGRTPIKFTSVKLKGLPYLAENTNLVNYSIFDSIFFNKNFNFTPVSHNTLYLDVNNKNLNSRSTIKEDNFKWDHIYPYIYYLPYYEEPLSEIPLYEETGFISQFNQLQLLDTYFYPVWAIEFLSMTDLETLGIMTYVAYPSALILVGLTLWTVMIGIISICSPSHE